MTKTLLLCCTLALASLSNVATAADGGQGFVRLEAGNSDVDLDVDGFKSSDDDTVYSLRGGYWFHANFGVEAFYTNFYDKPVYNVDLELSGYGLGAVAKKNFGANNSGFFIAGRAGVAHMEGKISDDLGHGEDSSNKAYFGAGIGYDFSDVFGLSLNYDVHKADVFNASVDADTLTLGAEVRF